ncbi:MAG: complex I subunit 5 family protein [Bacilli bacterium]|nr:complex I subunit 5 family protein [Bacillales bacterium]MDY2575449.1 complex I subunit 5 family protein [Bacilli bacterium]
MDLFLTLFIILFPIIGGIGVYFIGNKVEKVREILAISINAIELVLMIILIILHYNNPVSFTLDKICGLGLSFSLGSFNLIYGFLSVFLWMMTITFSKEYMKHYENKGRYYLFYLITLSGVMGVFLSNDFMTTFIFFELMSFSSYPLIIHDEKEESKKAGLTYLSIAVVSGMILLMGLFIIYSELHTLDFSSIRELSASRELSPTLYAGGILVMLGFGAKAGMYPLHIWLPKAHAVAPAPASSLLSGIMTKTGVFGIIILASNLFYGSYSFGIILLVFALITMVLGAILALFSVNLKRTLACSSMSQIGFILTGIAFMVLLKEEGSLGAFGSLLHMINHSFIKLVLFMCAGVVVMNIHALNLNDIKGFGRKKPFLMICFLIGTLGIMGIPSFNGYISKTMIHEAIVEYIEVKELSGVSLFGFKTVEYLFLFSGGLTIAYMIKLFVCLFIEKNPTRQDEFDSMKNYLSPLNKVVFVISTVMIFVIGILPNVLDIKVLNQTSSFYQVEEIAHRINFFSFENLKGALISISIGLIVYFFIVRLLLQNKKKEYLDLWPKVLDLETLVYVPLLKGLFYIVSFVVRVLDLLMDGIIYILRKTILRSYTYKYEKKSLAYRLGSLFDKKENPDPHRYANKADQFITAVSNAQSEVGSSFTFALTMLCLGIVIIITFLLVV